jgi:hypothetical protein
MITASSFKQLNYAAASLHCVQGLIVACLIPILDVQNEGAPEWTKGVYKVRKNLYILQVPETQEPKCDLPRVIGSAPTRSLNVAMGGMVQTTSDNFYTFKDAVAIPRSFVIGYIDVRFLICSFFFLSFAFQALQAWACESKGWVAVFRFVEYSFSASVMILAIAVQVGLTDVYLLCCLFGLMFATNMLGLIAEVLCAREDAWLPHVVGWVTCLVAYAPLLDAYVASMRCSDLGPPGYVHVIVFLEFALFTCFGLVQLYTLCSHDDRGRADMAYTVLSFTAKTLLAWLVMGPTLVNTQDIF